jgi:DNA-binding IclR family transcriptional regulator
MAEQPINLATATYLGVFSRAEQRVLQAIFKAIAEGGGRCVATLAMLARHSNTSRSTARNAIHRAVEVGLLEKMERRVSKDVLTLGSVGGARPTICPFGCGPLMRKLAPEVRSDYTITLSALFRFPTF